MNIKSVSLINGVILCGLAIAMAVPVIYDVFFSHGKYVHIFIYSSLVCLFIGVLTILSCRVEGERTPLSRQDIFLLVSSLWVTVPVFCALPFYIYQGVNVDFISSLYESTSGLTTTGSTIYPDVEMLPRAIHVWRFMLHFIGGVGIVALGIVALPAMKIGGMQLFLTENSDKSQKLLPRASQVAGLFVWTYIALIVVFAIWLKVAGMGFFDAVCHSISAIATGGFSTKNASIAFFKSNYITFILSLAMLSGGLTLLEIAKGTRNGFRDFFKNQQTVGYLKVIFITSFGCILVSYFIDSKNINIKNSVDYFFEILSSVTTTGFYMRDSAHTSATFWTILMTTALIGACSGSTTGGLKIFRLQILYSVLKHHIRQVVRPYDMSIPKYQGVKIDNALVTSITTFCALFAVTVILSVLVITMTGRDGLSSGFSVVSSICNVGYDVQFQALNWVARTILIIDMVVGRLEVIPILSVFTYIFWKK